MAPVLRAIVSAPHRWSKCEWPTSTKSARSTSAVPMPTGGAPGTRSMYASRKTTVSLTTSRKVETPSQSSVTVMRRLPYAAPPRGRGDGTTRPAARVDAAPARGYPSSDTRIEEASCAASMC